MAEYVKREAAFRMFNRYFHKLNGEEAQALVSDMKQAFLELPYAEAEPMKHGRWERLTYVMGWAKCSNCESTWELEKINAFNMDYCPNCGAKMDKEENE